MKLFFRTMIALTTLTLIGAFATTSAAKGEQNSLAKQLVGRWKVVRWVKKDKEGKPPPEVSVTMHFKKDKSWTGEMNLRGKTVSKQQGSWKLQGKTLITTSKKGADTMKVKITGGTLELTKSGAGDKLILKRQ